MFHVLKCFQVHATTSALSPVVLELLRSRRLPSELILCLMDNISPAFEVLQIVLLSVEETNSICQTFA